MKKIFTTLLLVMVAVAIWAYNVEVPTPTYFNDFSSTNNLTIVGSGEFITDGDFRFGQIYHNNPDKSTIPRANYLMFPSTGVLDCSKDSKEMTIGFWVNAKNATGYYYTSLFSAYAAKCSDVISGNIAPVFICQARGLLQINNYGWCDFTGEQNTAWKTKSKDGLRDSTYNKESTAWLEDNLWHYYTVTMTTTKAVVYIDGKVLNSWSVSGESSGNIISGLFTHPEAVPYICLGGNQAWYWGDPDTSFGYDDFAVYDKVLSPEQISQIIHDKLVSDTEVVTPTYFNDFSSKCGLIIEGSGEFIADSDSKFGQIYYNNPDKITIPRTNYLILPKTGVLDCSKDSKEMTIGFWVNARNATNYYSAPLFSAYASKRSSEATGNIAPVFICQARGLLQINNYGWCDFTGEQNTAWKTKSKDGLRDSTYNKESTAWLEDNLWHFYTVTITEYNAVVYIDGEVVNSWAVTNEKDGNIISGLFTHPESVPYICLGGNQSWYSYTPDASFCYDDFVVYNKALTPEQIARIIENKKPKQTAVNNVRATPNKAPDILKTVNYIFYNGKKYNYVGQQIK